MPLWTVCFDVTISVNVEAETEHEAEEAAQTMVEEIWDTGLPVYEGIDWTLGKVFAIKNEDTGVELWK